MVTDRDPGDAIPPGVAPANPAPLGAEEERAKRNLEKRLRPEGPPAVTPKEQPTSEDAN